MLYDKRWDTKLSAPAVDPMSVAGLVAWLETQPPETEYVWHNCQGECLLGRYLTAIGRDVRYSRVISNDTARAEICLARPWTYGAALERALAFL